MISHIIHLTSIAGLIHVNDVDLTTQILVSPCDTCSVCAINFFMAHTEQVWHGETKIWVVRSRSFTWTSPAMLVKAMDDRAPPKSFPSELLITLQYMKHPYTRLEDLIKDTTWAYNLSSPKLPFCHHAPTPSFNYYKIEFFPSASGV